MLHRSTVQIPKLRCSPFHSSLGVDPVGTAADYDGYLCVEVPLPWQRDITMSEPFSSLCDPPVAFLLGADGRRWRPQGLVPRPRDDREGGATIRTVRVTTWQQAGASPGVEPTGTAQASGSDPVRPTSTGDGSPEGSVGPLQRSDWLVDATDTLALLEAILSGDRAALSAFDPTAVEVPDAALYVCSHGQRDICCGSLGMELFGGLDELADAWGGEVRRCSHTGGHRFAATGITFPDGYAWAHMNPRVARAVAERSVEPRDLAMHVRGSTLVPKGPAQAIDRLGLIETGWDWADSRRSVHLVGFERRSMATDLRIDAVLPDGNRRSYEARIVVERFVPQITCGAITEPEYDVEPIWKVEDWRELAP